jgi:uncharacterized protein YeaO (DUF488 family)/tellurite resistance-related uncharacterized protein
MASPIRIKRVYEPAEPGDGVRVLVDRLWPRGLKKADARIDLWLRDVAPSPELRRWFGHRPDRWQAFRERYEAELAHNPAVAELPRATERPVTLLYAAKDEAHNHARVLLDHLQASGGLPAPARPYRRTDVFTEATVPAGLLRAHTTKPGVWGLIHVLEGRLAYRVLDPRRPSSETVLTPQAPPGVVEPTISHEVEPLGPVRFFVEFHRVEDE